MLVDFSFSLDFVSLSLYFFSLIHSKQWFNRREKKTSLTRLVIFVRAYHRFHFFLPCPHLDIIFNWLINHAYFYRKNSDSVYLSQSSLSLVFLSFIFCIFSASCHFPLHKRSHYSNLSALPRQLIFFFLSLSYRYFI